MATTAPTETAPTEPLTDGWEPGTPHADSLCRTFVHHRADQQAAFAAAAHFVEHELASLAFGATLPAARGHGHWTQHARARLRAWPDLWHAGIFSDFSRPLAEAIGFVPIIRFTLWFQSRSEEQK